MKTLWGFIKKEFAQTLRDPRMRLILFVAPCVQLTIFGVALSTEAKNIRLGVQGSPLDTELQEIYRDCLASKWFVAIKTSDSDPYEQIQKGDADAVMIAPAEGVSQSKERGKGEVQLLVNATNVTRAQSIERYFQAIVAKRNTMAANSPVQFDVRVLYNPSLKSAFFLIPGEMSLLVCLITILLTSMSISKEKEVGTFETLISAPLETYEVILGKTVPFVLLGMSNVPLIMAVSILIFHLPMRGSWWLLALSAMIFVICTVGIGLMISTFAKNQQQSMMGGFLYLFPSVLLSGLVFPIENMPWGVRIFSYFNPLTYFIEILRNITLKGGELWLILFNLLILLAMGVAVISLSWNRMKTTL